MVLPTLPTIGWGFIVIGVALFLLEAMSPGFFIAVPGTVLLILGVFALIVPEPATFWEWAPVIAVVTGIPATLGTIWVYRKMAPPAEKPTTQSADTLVGMRAVVTRTVDPGNTKGKVKIAHQVWSATADVTIPEGAAVRVARVDGVVLNVEPAEPPQESETHG